MQHYKESQVIPGKAEDLFVYIDDHKRFSSHMNQSSWMMVGSKMETSVDEKKGQAVGSHIRLKGKICGIRIFLDEVVTKRKPPYLKAWKTVGYLRLLIIGHYEMTVEIKPQKRESLLSVSIDYELPKTNAWLGKLLGSWYAKWCVQQMLNGAKNYFANSKGGE